MGGVVALGRDVWRIPTAGDYINSFLFVEPDGSLTLVDTGMFFARKRIVAGLRQIGKHPLDVQRIILTHAHSDHAGSAARLLPMTSASGATVHCADAEFIRAGRPAPAGSTFNRLLQGFPGMTFTPVPVITELHDGDVLDVAGHLRVHHTPGHTPGHVSLLHEESGVLITGDAIFNMNAKMTWPIAAACTDFPLTKKTAAALADLDYTVAAFTHGPDIRDRAREQVRGFLRGEGVVAPVIRAAHAKRIATAAAYGGGGVVGAGAAAFGLAYAQGIYARNQIGVRRKSAPYADGLYGPRKSGTSARFVMLGDSLAAGLGAGAPYNTPGAMLAQGISNVLDRPVRLVNVSTVGARSADLGMQVDRALHVRPQIAVIIIGANDVTHVGRPQSAVAHLEEAVRRLRAVRCQVVVGTCPDVGSVKPIPQPLRWVARRLSRQLAAAQMIACVRAGAHVVSFADELGPEFEADPDLFDDDRFHPGAEGYERVTQVLFPAVLAALDADRPGDETSGEIMELALAAADAAEEGGVHLSAEGRGPRGPWALIRKVRRRPTPVVEQVET